MVTLSNEYLTVSIKEHGAELSSVEDKKTGYEFIWQADDNYWGRHAPVLFPIVGRLKNDQYEYQGKTYDMNQHGFARDSMFKVEEVTEDSATFSLSENEETLEKYPFEFQLFITYTLEKKRVTVTYEVKNTSDKEKMYYGIGGHPAFNVSQTTNDEGEAEFDQISFRFEPKSEHTYIPLSSDGYLELDHAEKQIVEEKELTHESFKKDAFVYKLEADTEMVLTDEANRVQVRLNPKDMTHVGVWSSYPARGGFVCLEPWASTADDDQASGQLEEKYAINKLDPNTDKTHEYTIEFIKE